MLTSAETMPRRTDVRKHTQTINDAQRNEEPHTDTQSYRHTHTQTHTQTHTHTHTASTLSVQARHGSVPKHFHFRPLCAQAARHIRAVAV
jgi:hypothetical protein